MIWLNETKMLKLQRRSTKLRKKKTPNNKLGPNLGKPLSLLQSKRTKTQWKKIKNRQYAFIWNLQKSHKVISQQGQTTGDRVGQCHRWNWWRRMQESRNKATREKPRSYPTNHQHNH